MARKKFKHLTKSDRLMIEKMLKQKHSKKEIAAAVGVDESTIYREIKRGRYMHTLTDLTEEERYSPDIAHDKYRENLKAKGPGLKIDHDQKLADYIEKKIAEDGGRSSGRSWSLTRKSRRLRFIGISTWGSSRPSRTKTSR